MVINFNQLGTAFEHKFLAQVELILEAYFDLDSKTTRPFSDHQTSVQDSTYFHLPHIVGY